MKSTKILALLVLVAMCFTMLASCGLFNKGHEHNFVDGKCECGETDPNYQPDNGDKPYVPKQAEYNTTTSVMPSNWNELTYSDNNDLQIMSYIGSSFFDYDYAFDGDKYNADGSINKDAMIPGGYTMNYSAATKLEDVTSTVDAKWGYTDDQKAEGGYAWKITLRDDLKWDDGTPITAADFEYSMKAQLDPKFMNFRGNTYYDTLRVKNSRPYFFQDQEGVYEGVGTKFASNTEALAAGEVIYIDMHTVLPLFGYDATILFDAEGNPMPQWLAYNDETLYNTVEGWEAEGVNNDLFEYDLCNAAMFWGAVGPGSVNGALFEVGASYASCLAIFLINEIRFVAWEDVGFYAIPEENAIVICLDKAYSLLAEDGSLALWAGYYMASLPLVHQAKYEAAMKEPVTGSTLWTSEYNSSLETTASWGPYMLVEFESGSNYRLEKNPYWYGWNMEEYKNQYNITAINCRKVPEWSTQWMGFLNGSYDDASLAAENYADYQDSKYVSYNTSQTGTFGMQLYSNLPVLKASENNNGILAIREFRQAFNLALDRSDVITQIWPGTAVPCFGLVNVAYYYDIENGPYLADGGVYRNNPIAMAGILRAYGYTQGEDGLWSISEELKNLTLDEAYETLTGYNPTLAKEKIKQAIDILNADPEYYGYDASKNITLVYGSSSDTDKQRFRAQYIQDLLNDLTEGTALENKIVVKFDASAGSQWAEAFRSGATQIGFGYGFSGNAFNPFNIMGAFADPDDDLNYHAYWDTSKEDLTITMPEGSYDGAGKTITMSVQNWYFCLNGLAEQNGAPEKYNWDAGFAPANVRLTILSAIEEVVIKESRSVMLIGDGGGSFLGAKFAQFSQDYNTFMGFGGIRYMEVVYNDVEWTNFVKANGNDLSSEYLKSE